MDQLFDIWGFLILELGGSDAAGSGAGIVLEPMDKCRLREGIAQIILTTLMRAGIPSALMFWLTAWGDRMSVAVEFEPSVAVHATGQDTRALI
jgi:hypothetical protein